MATNKIEKLKELKFQNWNEEKKSEKKISQAERSLAIDQLYK